jgi:predicted Zn-dependent protease
MKRFAILVAAAVAVFAQARDPAKEAQRAQELLVAGRFDDAIRVYTELLRTSPDNALLLQNLCIAEYSAKRYHRAITHATAALKLQPDLFAARLLLGGSYLEIGKYRDAIDALKIAVAANPGDRNGRLMLGEALVETGEPAAAVEHLRAAAEMLADNPRVWFALGHAYEALGEPAAAEEAWNRLMALPSSLQSRVRAAEVHGSAEQWREAAAEWQEALRLAPDKPKIRIGLAGAQVRVRNYHSAMETLKPLINQESSQESAQAQFLYGASLLNLQQPAEAIPYLRAAMAGDASLESARAALGQALLQTGKAEEAIPWLAGAVSADRDGSVRFQLFRAYQLTHRDAEARRALDEYQRFRASLGARP